MVQIDLGERLIRLADKVLSKNSNETIGHIGGITNATANDIYVPTTKAVKEYVDEHEHQHGNIQNNGSIGSTANKPIITTTNGVLTTGSFGTSANTFCQGNDNRLSNDRNPISHAVNDTRYGAASSTNYGHIRVMDNLTSTGTTDALSANQGKELKTLVDTKVPITDIKDNLTSSDINKPLSANQGKELKTLIDTKVPITDIKDNLTSSDTNKPLSAKQGKALKSLADSKLAKNDTDYILVYDVFVEDDCCKDRWERWGQYQETLTVTNTTITVPANRMTEYMGGACYSNTFQDNNSIDDSPIIYPFAIPSGIEITITLTNAVDAYISKDQETVFMNSNKILQNTATTFNLDEGENLYIYVRNDATFNYTIKKYKAETINSIANIIYPIGSIYMSVNNTSPETLFGGRWKQLTDRFLLGAGNTYTNESTGGSKDAVVVSHKHRPSNTSLKFVASKDDIQLNSIQRAIPSQNSNGWYFVHAGQYSDGIADLDYTETVGENGTNKNMPPYLAVCMWKRTQ